MIQFAQPSPNVSNPLMTACLMQVLAERMANHIRELAFNGRNVDAETLAEFGWTPETLKRIGPTAVSIARRRSVRQISG